MVFPRSGITRDLGVHDAVGRALGEDLDPHPLPRTESLLIVMMQTAWTVGRTIRVPWSGPPLRKNSKMPRTPRPSWSGRPVTPPGRRRSSLPGKHGADPAWRGSCWHPSTPFGRTSRVPRRYISCPGEKILAGSAAVNFFPPLRPPGQATGRCRSVPAQPSSSSQTRSLQLARARGRVIGGAQPLGGPARPGINPGADASQPSAHSLDTISRAHSGGDQLCTVRPGP